MGGRIFATLAHEAKGYVNLLLSPALQPLFAGDQPDVFLPLAGGWGRMGATHIRLAKASEEALTGALRTAWRLRMEKNTKTRGKKASR